MVSDRNRNEWFPWHKVKKKWKDEMRNHESLKRGGGR
jgi:hypothetical protein